jgi:hypothetical protein
MKFSEKQAISELPPKGEELTIDLPAGFLP